MVLKVTTIPDYTQPQLDAIIAGNPPPPIPAGTLLSNFVMPTDWNAIQAEIDAVAASRVPYTGATANVDLGAFTITASNFIGDGAGLSGYAPSFSVGGADSANTANTASFATSSDFAYSAHLSNYASYGTQSTQTLAVDVNGYVFSDSAGALNAVFADVAATVIASTGSVIDPSISFVGDADTGIYRPTANTVAITTGGANRAIFDSTGMRVSNLTANSIVYAGASGLLTQSNANFAFDGARTVTLGDADSKFSIGKTNTFTNGAAGSRAAMLGNNNTMTLTGTATQAVILGDLNTVTLATGANQGLAVGFSNAMSGSGAVGIGSNNSNGGVNIGTNNSGNGVNIGVHNSNNANSGGGSVAIGSGNSGTNGFNSCTIGRQNTATGAGGTQSIGYLNTAAGGGAVAMGAYNTGSGAFATAMGLFNTASQQYALAVGLGASATATNAGILGYAPNSFSTINSTANSLMIAYEGNQTLMTASNTTFNQNITFADTRNIVLNATTGTKIGTATSQKLGFHDSAPTIQRAGAAQVAVATTAATNTTPFGFTTAAQADAIITLLNEMRAVMVEKGLIKGAA